MTRRVTLSEWLLVVLGAVLITAGVYAIANSARMQDGLAASQSDALARSSLLNRERVERIDAARRAQNSRWVYRFSFIFFGIWLIVVGAATVLHAFN